MTTIPLLATLTALICGPLLYLLARARPAFLGFLDGFVLVSIAGLVLLEAVPGTFSEGGAASLLFLAAGALGPNLVEGMLERARREAHLATLGLAVFGLMLHSLGDGVALAPGDGAAAGGHAHEALALAVIVHSIPVGLVVWWMMAPVFGPRWPAATILLMCAGTLAGYLFGVELSAVLGVRAFAWFQALVAGSILHVVFGRPHLDEHSEHREAPAPYEGLGNLVALAGLIGLHRLDPHASAWQGFSPRFLDLLTAAAPGLLLAYAAAAMGPARWRVAPGRGGLLASLGAGLAWPGAAGERCLASPVQAPGARVFAAACRTLGLPALCLSVLLLGWRWGLLHLAGAAVVAAATAAITRRLPAAGLAHDGHHAHAAVASGPSDAGGDDGGDDGDDGWSRLVAAVDASAAWVLLGLAGAALLGAALAPVTLPASAGLWSVPLLAALGVLLRLRAIAAVPLATALLALGLTPAAVLAFLLAAPTLVAGAAAPSAQPPAWLRGLLGAALASALGWLAAGAGIAAGAGAPALPVVLGAASALVLSAFFLASLLRRGGRRWLSGLTGGHHLPHA